MSSDNVSILAQCPGGCGTDVFWDGVFAQPGGTRYTNIRCVCDDTVSTGFARQVEVNREQRNQEAA